MEKSVLNSAIIIDNKVLVGDSHRYKSNKGEISLIHPCRATREWFEIFCCEGDLFQDVERYDTLEEAEKRITDLLETKLLN